MTDRDALARAEAERRWPTSRVTSRPDVGDLRLCEEGVTRRDEFQPCDRPAVALRNDPEAGHPYPVCKGHVRGDMVPLPAVLATLPAPVVSGDDPLRVEVCRLLAEFADITKRREITLGYIESRLAGAVTVADAPATEPEQAPERLCADCGHVEGVHACTFAAIRCAMCGCTAFRPAADDEGGQE